MTKKSDLFFCRYCDADLLEERVRDVAEDQNISEDEARSLIDDDGEIGSCSDCQSEEDSDY